MLYVPQFEVKLLEIFLCYMFIHLELILFYNLFREIAFFCSKIDLIFMYHWLLFILFWTIWAFYHFNHILGKLLCRKLASCFIK